MQKAKEEEQNGNTIEESVNALVVRDYEKNKNKENSHENKQCGIHKQTSEEYRIGNQPWALKIIGNF